MAEDLSQTQPGFNAGYTNLLQNSILGDLIGTAGDVANSFFGLKAGWYNLETVKAEQEAERKKNEIMNNLSLSNVQNTALQSMQLTKVITFGTVGIAGIAALLYIRKAIK